MESERCLQSSFYLKGSFRETERSRKFPATKKEGERETAKQVSDLSVVVSSTLKRWFQGTLLMNKLFNCLPPY